MLIRNAKSFHDLNNKKVLQAELLQLAINNESIKEQRVSDYKNPNKPPPVPPQYKTTSEVQNDVMEQQKQTIDNLRSLGLDYQVASQISQDMRSLKEGDGTYLKFNKFFPSFKSVIEKNVNIKSIGVDGIIEEIKRYFDDIDSSMGLNLAGTKSTTFFSNKPLTAVSILPSREDYEGIEVDVNNIIALYGLLPADVASLNALIAEIILNSPTEIELKEIDTFPSVERTRINRMIETLISKYHFPTSTFLYEAKEGIDATAFGKTQGQVRTALGALANSIKMINRVSIDKLKDLKDKIIEEQVKIGSASIALGAIINPLASASASTLIADNKRYLEDSLKTLKPVDIMQRLTTLPMYPMIVDDVPTTDGNAPEADGSNWIFQIEYNLAGRKRTYIEDINGAKLKKFFDAKTGRFNNGVVDINLKNYLQVGISTEQPDGSFDAGRQPRYTTKKEYQQLVKDIEFPFLFNRLHTDPNYDPIHHQGTVDAITNPTGADDRYINTQGFGIKPRNIKTKAQLTHGKKSKKKYDSDTNTSDDEKAQLTHGKKDIHIDINSHNGRDYHMSGDGFMKRRIKIGKGIEIKKDEPKFRAFGKYIIHMPQLNNNNILNFKHQSGGPIPAIKAVNVDDNFKEFVLDVLNSGRVNDRHYDSLTEPEKNHFLKVVRGAGIINDLKLKNSNHDKEKEDIERLELLIGEYNAGNDNEKMIKEAKTLIKKYISNGRISRQKGLEMLLEFD